MDRSGCASPTLNHAQSPTTTAETGSPAERHAPDYRLPRWYVADQKKKYGPLSWQRIVSLALRGEIAPDVMLFKEGSKRWVRAGTLRAFFGPKASAAAATSVPTGAPISEAIRPHFVDTTRAGTPPDSRGAEAPSADVGATTGATDREPAEPSPAQNISSDWIPDAHAATEPLSVPSGSRELPAPASDFDFESETALADPPEVPAESDESPPAEMERATESGTPVADERRPTSWPIKWFAAAGVAVVLGASIVLGSFVVDWLSPQEPNGKDRGELIEQTTGPTGTASTAP